MLIHCIAGFGLKKINKFLNQFYSADSVDLNNDSINQDITTVKKIHSNLKKKEEEVKIGTGRHR